MFRRLTMMMQGTFKCSPDECTITVYADVWEEWFKVATNTGEIELDRFRIDVIALKGDVVAEGFGSRVDQDIVQLAECQV